MNSFDLSVSVVLENEYTLGLKYVGLIKMCHINDSDLHLMALG